MTEIRIHGRGGQGAVVAAQMLAKALFKEGQYVQAFPAFGMERRGAPVASFVRFDKRPVRSRCEIYEPDHIIVLDPTLIAAANITAGLRKRGWILVNSDRRDRLGLPEAFRVAVVDASSIAVKNKLGTAAIPIVNTAILGAFARATGLVGLEAVLAAIQESVPVRPRENAHAARQAYDFAETL